MATPKLPLRGPEPWNKAKMVIITTEVTLPQATRAKPPQGNVKGKGKEQVVESSSSKSSSSDTMGIYSTHITSTESEREEFAGSRTPIHK
ncbi:hypothetical protein H5410_003702 [Solanum commersonii]|uniref:Uncharacterized protein n=1 Tax=Solanum commersonii TaxID=4109 RepID=A0A9J6B5N0_SOLCO|nr:hypothetical protein H5410_003702 [Solanum commersonii]